MLKRNLFIASLVFPIVVLFVWIGWMEYDIRRSSEVRISAEGYDPRSLISGHYLSLRLNWQKTDCRQFPQHVCERSRFDSVYKYYLPEDDAQYMDTFILQAERENKEVNIELVFAVRAGQRPYLKNMLVNGQPWKQWLDKQYH